MQLSPELVNMFDQVAVMQDQTLRECTTMLAGFIATNERDLDYMDTYMDRLWDFVEQESDAELLLNRYYDHIATFAIDDAHERREHLEDHLGYKAHVVLAAAQLAQDLHAGQVDKAGKDYFRAHLLPVGSAGFDWKEKTVGLLHDAAENTPHSAHEVIELLKEYWEKMTNREPDAWMEEMEDTLNEYLPTSFRRPTDEEWQELEVALTLLNHNLSATREEYITRLATKQLTIRVKLNDLKSNMDLSRIASPTKADLARTNRYQKEYNFLLEKLRTA